jgi:hypothetical protein
MSGHVFHPGHEPLHGVTVVVEGASGRTWVGRYHETNDQGVVLRDVAIHDPATATLPRGAWVERLRTFGVQVDEPRVILPVNEASAITPLPEWNDSAPGHLTPS